ncbi:MAG: TIGR01777 family oxidoreductase [Propionibacteriaceae bacterium]|nr:TIGR01777 family oxidoreductase [Propionibacteriaceae bacterium]
MRPAKTFLITGGTGLVGRRLTELLLAEGHGVKHLSRSRTSGGHVESFVWNLAQDYVDPDALAGVDVIVHLAGAHIAEGRWSEARKKELGESRIETLNLLKRHLLGSSHTVSTLISSSAQGYYEPNQRRVLHEEDDADEGFMGQLCAGWEAAATSWTEMGVRVAINRIGLVLSRSGGVLEAIMGPIGMRLSPVFGNGSQMYSWIHVDDLCRMIMFEAEDASVQGVFNAVAPNPVSQRELNQAITAQMGRTAVTLRAPKFLLHAVMGERAVVVTDSFNVSSDKVEKAGYDFQYFTIGQAMKDLI